MAHYRKNLAAAAALNGGIFFVEVVAGYKAESLSLIMDGFHNLSDEMALVFLYLALSSRSGSHEICSARQTSSILLAWSR